MTEIDTQQFARQLRKWDYDRYLCSLYATQQHRAGLWGLIAFNHEVARTAESVSEANIGMIRLKWWLEALDEIYGSKPTRQHEVVFVLERAIQTYNLPRESFETIIQARGMDLDFMKGFQTHDQFYDYLHDTAGTFHLLMAQIYGLEMHEERHMAVVETAKLYAIVGLLRSIPYHAEHGIIRWPLDVAKECGIAPEAIAQGVEVEALKRFVSYWLELVLADNENLKPVLKYLPPIHQKMHHLAMIYARELHRVESGISRLPSRIWSMPLRLWLNW